MTNEKQLNLFFGLAIVLGIINVFLRLTPLSTAIAGIGFSFIFFRKKFGVESIWKKGVILLVYDLVIIIIMNVL